MDIKDAGKELEQEEFKKQAAKLLENIDTDVHYADGKRSGMSTLCKKPIPPAKTSPYEKDVTCEACKAEERWKAIP